MSGVSGIVDIWPISIVSPEERGERRGDNIGGRSGVDWDGGTISLVESTDCDTVDGAADGGPIASEEGVVAES